MKKTSTVFDENLINKVRAQFGLNVYETKVWLSLLAKGQATIGEIAEISGVPRSRIYDVLESLEKEGFVVAHLGKPMKYMAIKPELVIERLKTKVLKKAEEKAKILNKVKETAEYKQLELLHKQGIKPVQPEEIAVSIKGRLNIYTQLKQIMGNAKKEVVLVTNINALKRKARHLKQVLPKLKKQKVSIVLAASGEPEEKTNISEQLGVKVRKINLDARFCVVDGKEALIITTPFSKQNEDIAIHIKSEFVARALLNLFKNTLKNE